jgi:hypothetical protein
VNRGWLEKYVLSANLFWLALSVLPEGSNLPSGGAAAIHISGAQTIHQRLLALFGRSVGPRLWGDITLGLPLDPVVAYGSRRVQALGNIFIGDLRQVAGFSGVESPDARKAVGLELG